MKRYSLLAGSHPHRLIDILDQDPDQIGRVLNERRLAVARFACCRAMHGVDWATSGAAIGPERPPEEIS